MTRLSTVGVVQQETCCSDTSLSPLCFLTFLTGLATLKREAIYTLLNRFSRLEQAKRSSGNVVYLAN